VHSTQFCINLTVVSCHVILLMPLLSIYSMFKISFVFSHKFWLIWLDVVFVASRQQFLYLCVETYFFTPKCTCLWKQRIQSYCCVILELSGFWMLSLILFHDDCKYQYPNQYKAIRKNSLWINITMCRALMLIRNVAQRFEKTYKNVLSASR
jgi:hypothetical protein